MNPENNRCPYDYSAVRTRALEFAGESETAVSFADETQNGIRKFRLQVFAGENILANRLYELTYTEGKDLIYIFSDLRIHDFDGYIDLRAGRLLDIFRVLQRNAELAYEGSIKF